MFGVLLYGGGRTARCAAAFIDTVYGFSRIGSGFNGEAAVSIGDEFVGFCGGGVICVKLVETVAVVVGGVGSEWVVVGLPEALLSFLKRGILPYVHSEAVFKRNCYLLASRSRKEM